MIENMPEIPLENFEIPQEVAKVKLGVENTYVGSLTYGVIGSGQCGGRLAKSFYDLGYKKTIALNTAHVDLDPLELPSEHKLKIGDTDGSGKDMSKGGWATTVSRQDILDKMRDIFADVDKIIICVGCGGGTGAGGLSILIEIATEYLEVLRHKESAKDVIVIAALPTTGELQTPLISKNNDTIVNNLIAIAGKGSIGPIILIDNSRVEKLYPGIPPAKFWSTINNTITGLFQMFNFMSKQSSEHISFDAQDYKAVMSISGLSVFGVARMKEVTDQVQLSRALQDNIRKTLLSSAVDHGSAKYAACIMVGDQKIMETVSMDTFNYGFDSLHKILGQANLFRGLYCTDKEGFVVYTFISGMNGSFLRTK